MSDSAQDFMIQERVQLMHNTMLHENFPLESIQFLRMNHLNGSHLPARGEGTITMTEGIIPNHPPYHIDTDLTRSYPECDHCPSQAMNDLR